MEDETLEISRHKLFDILSKAFTDICDESLKLLETDDKEAFVKEIQTTIDGLNHDILVNCKREKPIEPSDEKIEVDWS